MIITLGNKDSEEMQKAIGINVLLDKLEINER